MEIKTFYGPDSIEVSDKITEYINQIRETTESQIIVDIIHKGLDMRGRGIYWTVKIIKLNMPLKLKYELDLCFSESIKNINIELLMMNIIYSFLYYGYEKPEIEFRPDKILSDGFNKPSTEATQAIIKFNTIEEEHLDRMLKFLKPVSAYIIEPARAPFGDNVRCLRKII